MPNPTELVYLERKEAATLAATKAVENLLRYLQKSLPYASRAVIIENAVNEAMESQK